MRWGVEGALHRRAGRSAQAAVDRGLAPSLLGYRRVRRESVHEHLLRRGPGGGRFELVHPEAVAHNPLPRNVARRDDLPSDRGWWGYSFRDVPERRSAETLLATLPDCRVITYRDPDRKQDFYPAILTRDGSALEMRELRFRPRHGQILRRSGAAARRSRATWILERVYHNHSHWLSAHLPKLLLLADRDALADVLLPADLPPILEQSLRLVGLDPRDFPRFDPTRPLEVAELTVVGSDRFRPELLRLVQQSYAPPRPVEPARRVFISRARAGRRRLLNEEQMWPLLADAGFERVVMEDLSFEEQVQLMHETAVLLAPHGAGLTNMLFCPPGAQIVELADLSFPNPNFYATAAALGHDYWLVEAAAVGDAEPLERDLRVDVTTLQNTLDRLERRQ